VDLVRKVVSQAIKSMQDVMDDPPVEVLFLSMEDFYLKFSARFWVPDYNLAWEKQLEATDKIFYALKQAKIEIPYPIQTIHLKKK
jgi:small-conductance mechanosensitive channel